MAKKVILSLISIFLLFFLLLLLIPRKTVVSLFAVKGIKCRSKRVDIFFVFSGGFKKDKMGKSTEERVSFLRELLKKNPDTPFVFLDYKGGKKIIEKLLKSRYLNLEETSTYKYNEKLGGTENNVLELINILKKNPGYKKIGIVSSIYHEKRIKQILDYYLKKENIRDVEIVFLHNCKKQEIYTCSFPRYIKLIFHEVGGILYFKIEKIFN